MKNLLRHRHLGSQVNNQEGTTKNLFFCPSTHKCAGPFLCAKGPSRLDQLAQTRSAQQHGLLHFCDVLKRFPDVWLFCPFPPPHTKAWWAYPGVGLDEQKEARVFI